MDIRGKAEYYWDNYDVRWGVILFLFLAVAIPLILLSFPASPDPGDGNSTTTSLTTSTIPEENISKTISYTPSTKTICEDGTCTKTLYSGVMFAQNSLGGWVSPLEILRITKHSDDLTFHYDGIEGYFNITFEAGVFYNNNYYSMVEVKQMKPEIQFNFPTSQTLTTRKYAVNITNIPIEIQDKIQNITLTYKSHYGFTIDQLKSKKGKYLVKDIFELAFDDLKESGFIVKINKAEKRIYIGNLSGNFVDNSLYLDPTIMLQDADTENLDDAWIELSDSDDTGGEESGISSKAFSGGDVAEPMIKFNISSVPSGQTIDDAQLYFHVYYNGLDAGDEFHADAHHIYPFPTFAVDNIEWWEGTGNCDQAGEICWDERPNATEYNTTYESRQTFNDVSAIAWYNWNVTKMVSTAYNDGDGNISIWLRATYSSGSPSGADIISFDSKEEADTSLRPHLNITYSALPGGKSSGYPNTRDANISPIDVWYNDTVFCNFSYGNATLQNVSAFVNGTLVYSKVFNVTANLTLYNMYNFTEANVRKSNLLKCGGNGYNGSTWGLQVNTTEITVLNTRANATNLTSPKNATTVLDNTPYIGVGTVVDIDPGDVVSYRIEVSNSSNFANINYSYYGTNNFTTASALKDSTYYWRALTNSSGLNSSWSKVWNFVMDAAGKSRGAPSIADANISPIYVQTGAVLFGNATTINCIIVNFTHYINSTVDFTGNITNPTNGTLTNYTKTVDTLDKNNKHKFGFTCWNGTAMSPEVNTTEITINDTPPLDPTDISGFPVFLKVGSNLAVGASGGGDPDGESTLNHFAFYNMNDSTWLQNFSIDNTYVIQASDAHDTIQVFTHATTPDANSSGKYNETDIVGDSVNPIVANISWETIGGLTDATLTYNQILNFVRVDVRDNSTIDTVNLTIIKPDGTKAVGSQAMTLQTGSNTYNYSTDIPLDAAGTWTIYPNANDSTANLNDSEYSSFTVSTQNQSLRSGWYGYSNKSILSANDITALSVWDYDIYELEDDITTGSTNWVAMLTAINNSYDANIKVGINYLLNYNHSNTTRQAELIAFIDDKFPELRLDPYSDTVEYISFEVVNSSFYPNGAIKSSLNNISENATSAVSNRFIIYSKNFNSTKLDTAYISYTTLHYLNSTTRNRLITRETLLMRNTSSLNRIYVKLNSTLRQTAEDFQDDIIVNLRGIPLKTTTVGNYRVAEIDGPVNDIVVFNNDSTEQAFYINVSNVTGLKGKDMWDVNHKWLVDNGTLGNFTVNVSAYSATLVFSEDLNHIQLTSWAEGSVYKGAVASVRGANMTNGTKGGSWTLYGAQDARCEVFDPHFKKPNFICAYPWINTSHVENFTAESVYTDPMIVILADDNDDELDSLVRNFPNTKFPMYIAVNDYQDSSSWLLNKTNEVDAWLVLNESLDIFIDGLDVGVAGAHFSERMKNLSDYVTITKDRYLVLNTYTAYMEFCGWGDACMLESCVIRWTGSDAANPTGYPWEDWSLLLNKSDWFQSHSNVRPICQIFVNRTNDGSYQILNSSRLLDAFYAAAVLGFYPDIYASQPDFNAVHDLRFPYLGNDLSNSYLTDDNETYYRRFSNGIVYFNSTNKKGWFDDARVVDQVEICINLIDNSDGAGDEDDDFLFKVNRGNNYEFTATQVVWSANGNWYCKNLTATDIANSAGVYTIDMWMQNRGLAADGIAPVWDDVSKKPDTNNLTGRHSWWDNAAGGSPFTWNVYTDNKNWMVRIKVSETKKTSLDTTNWINQYNETRGDFTNITINSTYGFPIEIWSYPHTLSEFENMSYYNGTAYRKLNYSNTSTCDSNNPTFANTRIKNDIFKACLEESGTDTIVRFAAPSLSERIFRVRGGRGNKAPTVYLVSINLSGSGIVEGGLNNTNISDARPYITFNVTDDNSRWLNATIYIDEIRYGTNLSVGVNNLTYIRANATLADGNHTVFVNTSDNVFTNVSVTWNFTSDVTEPETNFTNPTPANNAVINRTVTINVSVYDATLDVQNLTIYIYNSTGWNFSWYFDINVKSTTRNISWRTNNGSYKNGVYYINATSYDTVGNFNYTETRTITVNNNKAPTVYLVSINLSGSGIVEGGLNNTNISDARPYITFNVTDDNSRWLNATIYIDNVKCGTNLSVGVNNLTSIRVNASLVDGIHTVFVNASDNVYTNISVTWNFRVNNSPLINNVTISPDNDAVASGVQISPICNSNKTAVVNMTISDPNGYGDIDVVRCLIWNSSNSFASPDYNVTLSFDKSVSASTGWWNASFEIPYNQVVDNFTINCSVNDSGDRSDSYNDSNAFEVRTLACATYVGYPILFGSGNPGNTLNATAGKGWSLNVSNKGNVNINISLLGTNMTSGKTQEIHISNVSWAYVRPFTTSNRLSYTATIVNSTFGIDWITQNYWRISLPSPLLPTTYNGTATYTVVGS